MLPEDRLGLAARAEQGSGRAFTLLSAIRPAPPL